MTESAGPGARSVVVAGGAGAVGSMFADRWRSGGDLVHILDATSGDDIRAPGPEATARVRAVDAAQVRAVAARLAEGERARVVVAPA